jgi:hypothetical protein
VHVVERVETFDWLSRNRFVTTYSYHHGYFDGVEREFRGFGRVEQRDTEQFAALTKSSAFPTGDNVEAQSHVPPVVTKTWFHTGIYLGPDCISTHFAVGRDAGDPGEYFREPGLSDQAAAHQLLEDTDLPDGLSLDEQREACRALKGLMLRQEVYAEDVGPNSTAEDIRRAETPYAVTEQSFTIRALQPRGANRHAVFFTHPREAMNFHYERNPADPRIQHALTLEVDRYGNVLKEATIGYGRRETIRVLDDSGHVQEVPNRALLDLLPGDSTKNIVGDQERQTTALITYTENLVTNEIEDTDLHRNPLPREARAFELTNCNPTGPAGRFRPADFVEPDPEANDRLRSIFKKEVDYEVAPSGDSCRRLIRCERTLYRSDDLTALLGFAGQNTLESLALPGENYKLAFTRDLLDSVYRRGRSAEALLPDCEAALGGQGASQGGYVQSQTLKADGRFPATDPDGQWWVPSGRSYFTDNSTDSADSERNYARRRFFLPRRYCDPFGQNASVGYDDYNLLTVETRDALDNRIAADENDYRVLQPRLLSDPNRNQTAVAFDALGMVVATALIGGGDSTDAIVTDLTTDQLDAFFNSPNPFAIDPNDLLQVAPKNLLRQATTRIVYDLDRFRRTRQANESNPAQWLPVCAATWLARRTRVSRCRRKGSRSS